jgi:multiple antibiotic resistance protein
MLKHTALFAFTTLFVVVDPIGLAPLFVTLTPGVPERERRVIAVRAVGIAAVVLLAFGFAGEPLLRALGITLPAFRIAGGVLLLLLAIDMVMVRHTGLRATTAGEEEESESRTDISVFPLAVPLIAGPGALTSMIMLTGRTESDPMIRGLVAVVLVFVLLLALVSLCLAGQLMRLLGLTGVNVVTRIFGILLAALAVQFISDGVLAIWHSAT